MKAQENKGNIINKNIFNAKRNIKKKLPSWKNNSGS
jgi:hypothetical protein